MSSIANQPLPGLVLILNALKHDNSSRQHNEPGVTEDTDQ
jgi:hypothetical protein